jgi:hypothetical protein
MWKVKVCKKWRRATGRGEAALVRPPLHEQSLASGFFAAFGGVSDAGVEPARLLLLGNGGATFDFLELLFAQVGNDSANCTFFMRGKMWKVKKSLSNRVTGELSVLWAMNSAGSGHYLG